MPSDQETNSVQPAESTAPSPDGQSEAVEVFAEPVTVADEVSAFGREIRDGLSELTELVRHELTALAPLCERLLVDAAERDEQERLRNALYEKLDSSRASFQLQLIRPFVLRLAAMHDLLRDFQKLPDLPDAARGAFATLLGHLQETLAVQGIEVIAPVEGEAFDKTLHYVIKAESTRDAALHERVVQTVVPGFVYLGPHDRTAEIRPVVVRPARIATWRYDGPEQQKTDSPAPA